MVKDVGHCLWTFTIPKLLRPYLLHHRQLLGLFRHKVIAILRDEGLLSQERIELLMSWRHSGFSAHNAVTVPPGDTGGIERLARYLLRAPASLERLELDLEGRSVRYRTKSRGTRVGAKTFEITEFLARLLQHVPEPRLHQVRYYGHYSNVARARRADSEGGSEVALESHRTRARGRPAPSPSRM